MKLADLLKVLDCEYELKTSTKENVSKEIDINIQNVMEYIDKEIESIYVYTYDKKIVIKLYFKDKSE